MSSMAQATHKAQPQRGGGSAAARNLGGTLPRRVLAAALAAGTLGAFGTFSTFGVIGALLAPQAQAQQPGAAAWPSRPVKILVGFPGGSTPDMAARILAEAWGKTLGQPVVVENRPGAAGNVAADAVAKANDDHTLGIVINGNLTSARLLNPKLPYDPTKDFALLSLLATAPLVLVAPAGEPGGAAWLSALRAAGDKWSYGSVGIGSVGHLGMEVVKAAAGNVAPVHVPFNGNPAVVTALLGGQIQMALVPPGIALPQVKAGKLQAVGLTGPKSALAADIAPLADLGLKVSALEVWVALVGPAGLSKAAQERLARDIPALLREAEVRGKLAAAGWEAQGTGSEGLAARVRDETKVLGEIITARGIKLE